MKALIAILLILTGLAWYWWTIDVYVQPGPAEVCSERVKRAIYRMGPGYDYKILADRRLMVRTDGKIWQRLRY